MTNFNNIRLNDLEYTAKNCKNILDDIIFHDEDERLLCKDIIEDLENTAAEEIKKGSCVQLPFIGSIRKNPLKETLIKNKELFKTARKILSKEDYKAHVACVFNDAQEEIKKQEDIKYRLNCIKNRHKKKYEYYCMNIGPAYANMFIYSKLNFTIIEYNQEFEDAIHNINNNE